MKTPTTLQEAIVYFSDPDRAHKYAVWLRWPNGVACPKPGCGSADVQAIKTRKTWRCKECKWVFSAKVGTIYESSNIPFTKWFPAIWFLANTKNGTSSHELGRALGVTQKTAWFMLHRIREAMPRLRTECSTARLKRTKPSSAARGRQRWLRALDSAK